MNPLSSPRHVFATLGAGSLMVMALVLGASSPAQVPPGWAAVSAFSFGPTPNGGISLVHSLTPGAAIPITGLPGDLLGPPPRTTVQWGHGAGSVLVRPSDGALVVGEHAEASVPNTSLDVHVITLNGSTVASAQAYQIGVPSSWGSVDQMAWLGDDILIANRAGNLQSGPLTSSILGLVRPSLGPPGTLGAVVPVPLSSTPSGVINALAIDPGSLATLPSGQVSGMAYFGMFLTGTGPSSIWSAQVSSSGAPVAPVFVGQLPDPVLSLAFDNQGNLLASVWPINQRNPLYSINVTTGTVTPVTVPFGAGLINGITVEAATGALLLVNAANTAYRLHQGMLTRLSSPAMTGGGTGIALNPSLWTYGAPSGTSNGWSWSLTPNPGGLPVVGNVGFSLTATSSTGMPALCIAALSLAPASSQIPPVTLLLAQPVFVHQVRAPAPSHTILLPIPNIPTLAGQEVYAQAGFYLPTGWVATEGVRIGIL